MDRLKNIISRLSRPRTIRTQLLIAFTVIVLLAVAIVSIASTIVSFRGGQEQVINQLSSVATLKQGEIETWIQGLKLDLDVELGRDSATPRMLTLLQAPSDITEFWTAYEEQLNRFQQTVELRQNFDELFLLDLDGRVLLSSDPTTEGKIYRSQTFFQEGLKGFSLQPPLYSPSLGQTTVIISQPVIDPQGQVLGVLAGRTDPSRLNQIMANRTGLGETGETYLVGANHALLTAPRFATAENQSDLYIRTGGVNTALDSRKNGSGLYDNYRNVPSIGVYHWIPELQLVLLAEQSQTEAFRPTYISLAVGLGVALVAVLLAGGMSLLITRGIANPLANLAQTATRIADGDLHLTAFTIRDDEIGILAQTFNTMTTQLRDLIDTLEQRVTDRTERLRIVATLGERLSGILHLEELLSEVVNQTKETFDYYHTHIYLLDDNNQNLVMVEGAGEAGAAMKAQGHHIPLAATTSLVARAARTAEVVRVDNVREAPDWLANPLLPATYAEMAVPIVSEGQVVGVLDVQEDKIAGLDEGDENLLRSLANQVAIAIRNARLFEQVETALADARAAQVLYLEQAWEKVKILPHGRQYLHTHQDAVPLDETRQQILAEVRKQALSQGRSLIVSPGEDGSQGQSLAAPINLGNKTIGALQLHTSRNDQPWGKDDLAVLETILEELAQTAERLRLYEDTRERAARERTIREITDNLRAAPNLNTLLETAVRELGQRLGVRHTVIELGIEPEAKSDNRNGQNGVQIGQHNGKEVNESRTNNDA